MPRWTSNRMVSVTLTCFVRRASSQARARLAATSACEDPRAVPAALGRAAVAGQLVLPVGQQQVPVHSQADSPAFMVCWGSCAGLAAPVRCRSAQCKTCSAGTETFAHPGSRKSVKLMMARVASTWTDPCCWQISASLCSLARPHRSRISVPHTQLWCKRMVSGGHWAKHT